MKNIILISKVSEVLAPAPNTVSEVLAFLNEKYGWHLPLAGDFPVDSVLYGMWMLPVKVDPTPSPPSLYKACALQDFAFNEHLSGRLIVYVTDGQDVPVTPCVS